MKKITSSIICALFILLSQNTFAPEEYEDEVSMDYADTGEKDKASDVQEQARKRNATRPEDTQTNKKWHERVLDTIKKHFNALKVHLGFGDKVSMAKPTVSDNEDDWVNLSTSDFLSKSEQIEQAKVTKANNEMLERARARQKADSNPTTQIKPEDVRSDLSTLDDIKTNLNTPETKELLSRLTNVNRDNITDVLEKIYPKFKDIPEDQQGTKEALITNTLFNSTE